MKYRRFLALGIALAPCALLAAPALADTDVSSPVVSAITPTSAQVHVAQSYHATYTDAVGVSSCSLYVDGSNRGGMTLSGSTTTGSADMMLTLDSGGNYVLQARCLDAAGNTGLGSLTSVTVNPVTPDTQAPTVGNLSPYYATSSMAQSYSATFTDNVGVTGCSVYIDGVNRGDMNLAGNANNGTANLSLTLSTTGTYGFQTRCHDAAGNVGTSNMTTVTVNMGSDTSIPSIPSALMRVSGGANETATFNWTGSTDNMAVTGYDVQLDGGAFLNIGNVFNYTTGALSIGTHTFKVRAHDAAGNMSTAASLDFVVVSDQPAPTQPPPVVRPTSPPFLLVQLDEDAHAVVNGNRQSLLNVLGRPACEMSDTTANTRTFETFGTLNANMYAAVSAFIGCGTQATLHLGAGERIGIVNSFRAAFGRMPSTEADWSDVIKIGNGRFPGQTSATAEASARARFQQIYLRQADLSVASDNNAVTVMAYGLRPMPRKMNAEAAAILTFRAIFKTGPVTATQWDTVRAIAYSGASR